jgi:hypothetical protein
MMTSIMRNTKNDALLGRDSVNSKLKNARQEAQETRESTVGHMIINLFPELF